MSDLRICSVCFGIRKINNGYGFYSDCYNCSGKGIEETQQSEIAANNIDLSCAGKENIKTIGIKKNRGRPKKLTDEIVDG